MLGVAALVATLGPPVGGLGPNVRVVYLHGAWVWSALIGFAAAAGCGLLGWIDLRRPWLAWSAGLGRSATFFWVAYLPLSLWAMQANWNGLYLAEPRWRVGLHFAVAGLLLQAAAWLIGRPKLTGLVNLLYFPALVLALANAQQVLHPPSPVFSSDSVAVQSFFLVLTGICMLAGWQLARAAWAAEHS